MTDANPWWLPDGAAGAGSAVGDSAEWEAAAYRWRPHAMPTARNRAIDAAGAAYELKTLWGRAVETEAQAAVRADTLALWARMRALPAGTDPATRARELVSAAYRDGTLRGVATASLARIDHLCSRFAFVRVLVVPDERRAHLSGVLASHSRAILDRWAEANPGEGVKGVAYLIEARELLGRARRARWENTGAIFAGYFGNTQLRVSFFDHAEIDPPEAP